jgi:hypothetical protein
MKTTVHYTRPFALILTAAALAFAGPAANRAGAGETPITAENWTEAVSFKPDLATVAPHMGKTIDRSNYQKLEKLLPQGLRYLIRKYKFRVKVAPYRPVRPSAGYIKATNDNRGKARIVDLGKVYDRRGIEG